LSSSKRESNASVLDHMEFLFSLPLHIHMH
jgi:hypothetical protein